MNRCQPSVAVEPDAATGPGFAADRQATLAQRRQIAEQRAATGRTGSSVAGCSRRPSGVGPKVAVLGNTTGSHLGLPDEEEMHEDVIWSAEVRDGRLSRWSIIVDTPETRRALQLV
jgi:hypothetical protein